MFPAGEDPAGPVIQYPMPSAPTVHFGSWTAIGTESAAIRSHPRHGWAVLLAATGQKPLAIDSSLSSDHQVLV
jgi:hypothetical protein